jgi:hypothetical protein
MKDVVETFGSGEPLRFNEVLFIVNTDKEAQGTSEKEQVLDFEAKLESFVLFVRLLAQNPNSSEIIRLLILHPASHIIS